MHVGRGALEVRTAGSSAAPSGVVEGSDGVGTARVFVGISVHGFTTD